MKVTITGNYTIISNMLRHDNFQSLTECHPEIIQGFSTHDISEILMNEGSSR